MKSILIDSKTYELAPKTMNIAKKEDLLLQSISLEDAYKKQFAYVQLVLGTNAVKEIFNSTNINEIDLSKLTLIVDMISVEYDREINENKLEQLEKYASSSAVNKLIEASNSISRLNNIKSH